MWTESLLRQRSRHNKPRGLRHVRNTLTDRTGEFVIEVHSLEPLRAELTSWVPDSRYIKLRGAWCSVARQAVRTCSSEPHRTQGSRKSHSGELLMKQSNRSVADWWVTQHALVFPFIRSLCCQCKCLWAFFLLCVFCGGFFHALDAMVMS